MTEFKVGDVVIILPLDQIKQTDEDKSDYNGDKKLWKKDHKELEGIEFEVKEISTYSETPILWNLDSIPGRGVYSTYCKLKEEKKMEHKFKLGDKVKVVPTDHPWWEQWGSDIHKSFCIEGKIQSLYTYSWGVGKFPVVSIEDSSVGWIPEMFCELVQDTLKVKDLVKGEIYFSTVLKHEEWNSIFISAGKAKLQTELKVNSKSFEKDCTLNGSEFATDAYVFNFKVATQEEKDWLNASIMCNKFLEKSVALQLIQYVKELDTFLAM